ncbi:DNA helicase UvrD [Pontibacillus halophilus JSM 076056 = DSM 19796]|uniref:DNA 3'-5' helicase n=1 Tax=Pontibacillus halophilus JSM 076056 = DSM 19796 TaxID=1385510 RepID=A0A0A5GP89_9BACI|nr:ATP-dependent helicase [Pontibacillus halophilus]KGX93033.1 DNA helicase UvrD [Pontibacillus halophilus JSM 076056 = DSM 19796]
MDFFAQMEQTTGVYLNEVQKRAVTHTDGPLLLLASPGSGKTTTLNMKIGYLLMEKNIHPSRIMAVTFSKASARDMSERFDQFFPEMTDWKVHFSTIHSFAYKIVREWLRKNEQDYLIIEGNVDEEEMKKGFNGPQVPLHKHFILKKLYEEENGKQISDDEMDELMTYISFVKNRMLEGKELAAVKLNVKQGVSIFQAYERFKKEHDHRLLLDFDDMLTYCHQILLEDEEILSKYQRQFQYILTDESQDNSVVQHEIVEMLAKPQQNLCVVADDDQSIFRWRGSDVTKLLQFEKAYPGATVMTMSQNYRSSQEIVAASNQFIKRNQNRYPKEMFTENPSEKPIEIKSVRNYEDQLKYVTEQIKEAGTEEEVAILYRNNASAVPLADKLNKAGIQFYMRDIDPKFFKHWIVEDILNFMRFSYNICRVDILERIHTKFNAYITKQQVAFLKRQQVEESVFDTLGDTEVPSYQAKNLRKAKKVFIDLNSMVPDRAIRTIREHLGYDRAIQSMCEKFGFNGEHLFGILDTLEEIAAGLGTLKGFANRLKELERLVQTSKFNKHDSHVTLTTFHSAKGLEYDKVYMIDLINGVVPSKDDLDRYRNKEYGPLEEAVRLFYVGMTRARHHLEMVTYHYKGNERVAESMFVTNVKKIVQPASSTTVKKRKSTSGKKVDQEDLLQPDDIEVGRHLYHPKFGRGVIKEYGGEQIGITFKEAGYKSLSLTFCLENDLLQRDRGTGSSSQQ